MVLPMTKNDLIGTDFQIRVWKGIKKIPKGSTLSYKELAKKINKPKAYRAVANACGKNPYPIIIPCHRVIGSNGNIGGYSDIGGVKKKIFLLKSENVKL